MFDKLPRPLLWLLVPQGVGLAAGVIFTAAAARNLTPQEFAWLGTWQVVLGYGTVFAELGTAHVGVRRLAAESDSSVRARVAAAVFGLRGIGLLLGAAAACIAFVVTWSFEVAAIWTLLLAFAVAVTAANAEWWHLAARSESRVAAGRLARHGALLMGAVWLTIAPAGWLAPAIYVGAALVQTAIALGGLPSIRFADSAREAKALAREGGPLVVALLAQQWVWNGALLRSARELAPETLGGLIVGYRCYLAGIALLTAFASYLLPRSAAALQKSPADLRVWLGRVQRRAGWVSVFVLLGAPCAGWLAPWIFGDRYAGTFGAATLYGWSLVPVLWRIVGSNTLVAAGRTPAYLAATGAGVVAAIAAAWALPEIWWFGPVLVLAIGETVFALASHALVRRSLQHA